MSKIYKTMTSIVAGVLLCTLPIQAQPSDAAADTLHLDGIIITASKIPLTQRETTKPYIIIDRRQIEQSGVQDLGQLLNRQSGIRVNDSWGSPANNRSVFIQGASNQYALIMIDGMAVSDPSGNGGAIDLRAISMANVERIEVIKGSQSTLYGTDAIAGVINIITRRGGEEPFNASGRLSYGSMNTFHGSGGIRGSVDGAGEYNLNYSRESTDGISAAEAPEGAESFGKDGFTRDSFYGRITLRPAESLAISPFLNYSSFRGDYDGGSFQDAENSFEIDLFNPGVEAELTGDRFRVNGAWHYTKTDRVFASQFGENVFDGRLHHADLYGNYRFGSSLHILAGVHYQDHTMADTGGSGDDFSAQITSPYATLIFKNADSFNAELGYRLNHHSEYGNNSTISFAPSYFITSNVKLFASVGTGFKTPTLSELFGPFGANPGLEPQKSRYLNLGVEGYFMDQSLKVSTHYFDRRIDDVIVYTSVGYENRDRQEDHGFELSADWLASRYVTVSGFYNFLEGEIAVPGQNGQSTRTDNLYRRPKHSAGGTLTLNLPEGLTVSLSGEWNGDRTDLFFNPANNFAQEEVTLDAYTLMNAYAEYRLMDGSLAVFGDFRNLFNTDFTEVYGFSTLGFNTQFGIRFSL